jgi:hypothetical protein
MDKLILFLMYISLCIYCLLDAYQTKLLLSLGAIEINPIMAWIMGDENNCLPILCWKVFFLLALGALLIVRYGGRN